MLQDRYLAREASELSARRPSILVIGSMNMDLVIRGLDRVPEWGETVFAESHFTSVGGKGANQAIAAAKQGADVYMVGCIGEDPNGHQILSKLEQSGVHTDYVECRQDTWTGLATINIGPSGRYFSVCSMGGNMRLDTGNFERALDEQAFDLIEMQLEMPLETAYRVYEIARQHDTKVFLDAGPAMSIPLERFKGIYVISPNEAETEALTGINPGSEKKALDAAQKLYEMSEPEHVLLKLGERGALLYDAKQAEFIPPFKVKAIDTTAAGDTFGAAFGVQICKGADIVEAVKFAHAAAGICVGRRGGQPSIPTEEEVKVFLETWNGDR